MQLNPCQELIRSALSDGPCTEKQICELTGLPEQTVRWILLWGYGFDRCYQHLNGNNFRTVWQLKQPVAGRNRTP